MNSAEWAIARGRFVGFVVLLVIAVGVLAYTRLGQLEDPEFTIRTAVVYTQYPGARAVRVEQEVTEPLEEAIQQLGQLDYLESYSRDGLSLILVHIQEGYGDWPLRQIWDELRHRVHQAQLPEGVTGPFVDDDYGDVFSLLLSVSGEGYSYADLDRLADDLRRELLRVPDVARVEVFGRQGERVFVETSRARIAELGLLPHQVVEALNRQNVVAPAGLLELGPQRLNLFASGVFDSLEDIRNLTVRSPVSDNLLYLRDFAEIRRGYAEPPESLLRFNAEPALALGIVPVAGANVVDLGERVDRRITELTQALPVGVEVGVIADQAREVRASISEFMRNLITAVLIVIAVLLLSLGLRTGLVVASGVPLTIVATFIALWIMAIDLHRVSLGALVIVLGMLVDNAIVIAELTLVKIQRGLDRLRAAREAISETAWPLLAATLIAALAFAPVALTESTTGEFTRSLFWVVAASLLISWLLAVTMMPLLCYRYLKAPQAGAADPHDQPVYRGFRRLLTLLLRWRGTTLTGLTGLLAAAVLAFMLIPQIFFPPAQRPQFLVDYWLPEGTRIERTAADLEHIEQHLLAQEGIASVTAFIGSGAPRFYLPMLPEQPNPAFAQLLVELAAVEELDATLIATLDFLQGEFPDAEPRVRPLQLGDPVRYPLMLRITGPDREVLRRLAGEVRQVFRDHAQIVGVRHDWRNRIPQLEIPIDQERARRADISSTTVAEALSTAFAGQAIGIYREDDRRIPIVWRFPLAERRDPTRVETMVVWPERGGPPVPLLQVAQPELVWDDPLIRRRDRERTLTVQADLLAGATAHQVMRELQPATAALELPPGYRLEWDGEAVTAAEARAEVLGPVPVVLGLIVLILMAQFNSYRRTLIILITVPLGLIGVSAGLLLLNQPFGFMALLGVMSLAGMIIRNAIVMIEQIDLENERGADALSALLDAATSRVRPVLLAALTTVLGMLPLALSGPFWAPMAIAIMFGLGIASVLTLIAVPVLYAQLFRVPKLPVARQ